MSNEQSMSLPKLPQSPRETQSVTELPEATSGWVGPDSPLKGEIEPSPEASPAPKRRGRPPGKKATASKAVSSKGTGASESEQSMRARVEAEVRAEIAAEAQQERVRALAANSLAGDGVEITEGDPNDPESVMINFVDDGLTLLGRTWTRGEELAVKKGSDEWKQTLDGRGRSILEYSEKEQLARWQRRIFSQGAWLGTGYDLNDPSLTADERAMLKQAEERRAIRSAQPGSRMAGRTRLNSN